MKKLLTLLIFISLPVFADQYFQDGNGRVYFLSTIDINNGGIKYLPSGAAPITDAQAASAIAAIQALAH